MVSSVQHLSIELLWDYVDSWDLVVPCAVANHQAVTVRNILFIYEKTNSLYKGTFNLQKNSMDKIWCHQIHAQEPNKAVAILQNLCQYLAVLICSRDRYGAQQGRVNS